MSDPVPSLLLRILGHDATRRGAAAAIAGVVVAVVSEVIWPSA